eukprot:5547459-Amphidinium_carterae.1
MQILQKPLARGQFLAQPDNKETRDLTKQNPLADVKMVGKCKKAWVMQFLKSRCGALTDAMLSSMELKDPENVMLLFQFETQVMAWQKLPSIITDAEIASRVFTKRAQEVGSRLGRFVANGSIQSNGDLQWQRHGCYSLEMVGGKCTRVHHISGSVVTVPAHLT